VAFAGDDTWILLFPESFEIARPYPSFNVKDLHTVDDGCIAQLPGFLDSLLPSNAPAAAATNATSAAELDAVILHFLGVDHVGHRYEVSFMQGVINGQS